MGKRKTHKEFVNEMRLLNSNIEIIGQYINSSTKIKCKCLIHNVIWDSRPTHLLQGHGCRKCGGEKTSRKLSLSHNEFVQRLSNVNANIEILSGYINNSTYINCRCNIDGHEWKAKPANLLSGYGCPKCAGNRKKTTEVFKNELLLANPNIEVLGEYKSEKDKILCRCKIHNCYWETTPCILLKGTNCPKCNYEITSTKNKRRKTNITFESELYMINPNIKLLSKYYNAKTKIICECLIDGNIFSINPRNLLRGQGCSQCGLRKRKGENNPAWQGGISFLQSYLRKSINKWKKDSLIHANFLCDITGTNKNLIIHHKYGFNLIAKETLQQTKLPIHKNINEYSQEELDLLSTTCLELHYNYGLGICLNSKLHKLFHHLYGNRNNTPDQYNEFKQKVLSKEINIDKFKSNISLIVR